MRTIKWMLAVVVLAPSAPAAARAQSSMQWATQFDARSNVFGDPYYVRSIGEPPRGGGDGLMSPPSPGGGGGGYPPPGFFRNSVSVGPAGLVLRFSSVTGSVSCCGVDGPFNGPDGGPGDTDINTYLGLYFGTAGIRAAGRTMFLAGVFERVYPLCCVPARPAPARLEYGVPGGLAYSAASYAPRLGQVFFIGDGLTGTGSGAVQDFFVPAGTDRLVLGFADAFGFTGDPGHYDDNRGTLEVALAITPVASAVVPEPSTWALFGTGLLGVAGVAARRRRSRGTP